MTRNSRAFGNMTHVMRIVLKFSLFGVSSISAIPGVVCIVWGMEKDIIAPPSF
jgi:hypothetical protein